MAVILMKMVGSLIFIFTIIRCIYYFYITMIGLFLSSYHFSNPGIKSEAINGNTHKEVTRKPSDGTSHVSHRNIVEYANSFYHSFV